MAVTAVAMTTVATTMEVTQRAAEAAMDRAAIGFAAHPRYHLLAGTAAAPRHKSHRHGADRRAPHQCQHNTARAFHGQPPGFKTILARAIFINSAPIRQVKRGDFTASCGEGE
jgi:hypothetical protein